jgi:hypothetical protein
MTETRDMQSEADAAWRAILHSGNRTEEHVAATEAKYGPPSWAALLYRSIEEQRDAEKAIAADIARGGAELH